MFSFITETLLPVLILLLMGWLFFRIKWLNESFVEAGSKLVFNVKGIRSGFHGLRYFALMGFIWLCNWAGIELLKATNLSVNASGALMIAPLAGISYLIQKYWVFRRP